jgi:hypothetical protein
MNNNFLLLKISTFKQVKMNISAFKNIFKIFKIKPTLRAFHFTTILKWDS